MTFYNNEKKILSFLGQLSNKEKSFFIFEDCFIEFINEFNSKLKKNINLKLFPDLSALVFWSRNQNIKNIKNKYYKDDLRVGVGIIFHITPANMPLNFVYSYFVGLLTGNLNIVRLPSKNYTQIKVVLKILNELLSKKKYNKIKKLTYFIQYDHVLNENITKNISSICDLRVIWGGDESIFNIRQIPIQSKSREITFNDKYSITVINSNKIIKLNQSELFNLVNRFYSDSFFIDQNACSSPHFIFWVGSSAKKASKLFWENLNKIVIEKYSLPSIGSIDRLTNLFLKISENEISNKINLTNSFYRLSLKKIPNDITDLKGQWGMFFEFQTNNLSLISKCINDKVQTVLYFGFEKNYLLRKILNKKSNGIDRIMPIGSAHNFDIYWDGYDLIRNFSKVINLK